MSSYKVLFSTCLLWAVVCLVTSANTIATDGTAEFGFPLVFFVGHGGSVNAGEQWGLRRFHNLLLDLLIVFVLSAGISYTMGKRRGAAAVSIDVRHPEPAGK